MSDDAMATHGHDVRRAAAEVCNRFAPGEAARGLLRDEHDARDQYLDALIERRLPRRGPVPGLRPAEARGGLVGLPVRPAGRRRAPARGDRWPLAAAEAWVADPTEENRRAALPAAEAAGYGTAAGCAAASAFRSGGSLGPPNVAADPARRAPHRARRRRRRDAGRRRDRAREGGREVRAFFLSLGIERRRGRHPWPDAGRRVARPAPDRPAATATAPDQPPAGPRLNWE